jgi:hypothetical protein
MVMRNLSDTAASRARVAPGGLAWLAAVLFLLSAESAAGQQASPQPQPEPAPAEQAAPEDNNPFGAIGRWFEQGAAQFRSHMQGAKNQMDADFDKATASSKAFGDKAVEVGKTTGAAMVAPLTGRVVNGREPCVAGPNRAPDCQAAAETLCKMQGYATGKSMDFTSAEQCPPKVYLSRDPARTGCTTVTFVNRAMCQ